MTRKLAWTPDAWADYVRWQGQDSKTLRRTNRLIADTVRSPYQGIGKPYSATMANVRTFNTTGPVVAADHYRIPPLERIDLDTVLGLIRDKKYFVLHAPRQTGKTSALLDLRDILNGGGHGEFRCVYANVEAGQAMRDNVTEGMRTVLSQFALRASLTLGDDTLQRVCTDASDLGLVAQDPAGTPRIANPIYAEVVPRHLNYAVQAGLPQQVARYVDADRRLDVAGLIAAFQEFFREHSEHWVQRFEQYHEAGPQSLLQAHLQRVVNGGGRIEREYALGRGRTDLLIVWPQGGRERRFVVECKVLRKGLERTIADGVEQTRGYADRCGAEAGHLIVFDRSPDRTCADKIFRRAPAGAGVPVTVWGM